MFLKKHQTVEAGKLLQLCLPGLLHKAGIKPLTDHQINKSVYLCECVFPILQYQKLDHYLLGELKGQLDWY